MSLHNAFDYWLDHFHDNVLDVLGLQNFAALLVDNFALLVHDVVILQDDFADVEVIAFDPLLRRFYSAGNHPALDRLIFFKAKSFHHIQHIVSTKTFHQLVAQRQIELCGTRVALTSRTSAQLVIDPARFMALSADDMQAANLGYAFTEDYVGAASRHVSRNGHRARLTSVGNNFSFRCVMLRV
ncbi:hypothetical protein D3C71_1622830 [compost metagenome]